MCIRDSVEVVGDAVVAAHLAADDVLCADDDDDLGLLLELQQHLQLGVRLKARQHAGGVVVVEQLAEMCIRDRVVEAQGQRGEQGHGGAAHVFMDGRGKFGVCLLYTSPSFFRLFSRIRTMG